MRIRLRFWITTKELAVLTTAASTSKSLMRITKCLHLEPMESPNSYNLQEFLISSKEGESLHCLSSKCKTISNSGIQIKSTIHHLTPWSPKWMVKTEIEIIYLLKTAQETNRESMKKTSNKWCQLILDPKEWKCSQKTNSKLLIKLVSQLGTKWA